MTTVFKLVFISLVFAVVLGGWNEKYALVESSESNLDKLEAGINDPSSEPDSNLDRSKRLRDGLFEPCRVWTIRNDEICAFNHNSDLSTNNIPIIGLDSLLESDETISESALNEKDGDIGLYKPYRGVLVEYNLTSFSKFISRIVEVEIEMHLTFDESIMKAGVGGESSISIPENNHNKLETENDQVNEDSGLSSLLLSNQYQSISFLLVAGYFRDNDEGLSGVRGGLGRGGAAKRTSSKYRGVSSRDIKRFIPVFQDNVTLSRQNVNQYYAKYGITTFKDKLTSVDHTHNYGEDLAKENIGHDSDHNSKSNNIYINDNKINIDRYKLSFMYLPHNDTKLYFSSSMEGKIVLPKLHIKAIQTHQEASDDPVNDNDSSEEEKSRSKRIMIVTLLLAIVFAFFTILFYIFVSWYLREIQNKHS
ncbi:hypothetical protein FG386_003299 [Cryptosporidium ryanae]|uniref:uncharacterized protein n=1 Tax=Cryptosporidium ryanae TaxID=515981 RepID=UPI00351A0C8F|nr:hypothetical protein FG386_003299 [Cryptosporidium ryanae]